MLNLVNTSAYIFINSNKKNKVCEMQKKKIASKHIKFYYFIFNYNL